MPAYTKPIAVLVSAALAVSIAAPPAEAQSRRAGAAIGVAAGIGILGLILSQQGARAKPQRQRSARPAPSPRAPAKQGPDMASVQRALAARGYDVGTPNGKAGPKTKAAITAYQRDNGMPATGKLNLGQMTAIVAAAGGAAAGFTAASAAMPTDTVGAAPVRPNQPIQQSPILTAAEGELGSGPRELAVGPDDPAWASGTWTGSARCWQRIYDIKMIVPVATPGAKARIEYRWREDFRARQASAPAVTGTGAIELDASKRGLAASAVLSGDKDHPFGQLTVREGSGNLPTFRSAPCSGLLPLVRSPETVPKPQIARTGGIIPASLIGGTAAGQTGNASANGIFGQWDGELKCTRGPVRQLFMRFGTVPEIAQAGSQRVDQELLAANRPGRVAAQITQLVNTNGGGEAVWTRLVGEYSEEAKGYRFVGVTNSGGDSPLRNLLLQQTDTGIEGIITGEPCTDLKGTRPDPLGSYEMASVRLPTNGGSFYAARDIGARCDALIKWTARTDKEYAARRNQRVDVSLLFVDPEFVPVFGRTIEAARPTTVGADIYNAIRECGKDPLTKPRMAFLETQVVNRIATHTGFDWSAITFAVKNVELTRAALNRLNVARVEATQMTDLSEAIIHLASARVKFDSAPVTLLPSQKTEINDAIKEILSKSAERVVEDEEKKLQGEAAWARLDGLRSLRLFSSPVTTHLSEEARKRALARLAVTEQITAAEIFDPMFAKARALPASIEGIAEMDKIEAAKLFVLLSEAAKTPLQTAWNQHRDEKHKEAVGLELSRAIGAPRDHIGLQYGATWLAAFKQRWSGHQNSDVTKSALKFFFDDRKARLREALPSFQAAISKAQPDAKASLMDRFLVLPEDKRDPISLEYELAVAGL